MTTDKKQVVEFLEEFKNNNTLKNLIIENSPSGVIIVDTSGTIKYINQSIGRILGSMDTVGYNMLEIDTIKKSVIYEGLLAALKGNSSEFKNKDYTSFTTKMEKKLNIYIYPEINNVTNKVENIIILIHDVTKEHLLNEKIERNYIEMLETLASLVDTKDFYTGEHSKECI